MNNKIYILQIKLELLNETKAIMSHVMFRKHYYTAEILYSYEQNSANNDILNFISVHHFLALKI